jgi:hypothetical protein
LPGFEQQRIHPSSQIDNWTRVNQEKPGATSELHAPSGNQVAQRFAQSCPLQLPSPSVCPFGGACHTCPAQVQAKPTEGGPLTVNEPGDRYEQEADRVADQVMSMPEPHTIQRACSTCDEEGALQTKPLAEQITPLIQRQVEEDEEEEPAQAKLVGSTRVQRQEEEEEPIQTKPADGTHIQRQEEPEEDEEEEEPIQAKRVSGQTQNGSGLTSRLGTLRGSGHPLPPSARDFFEPRFGHDFGQVRIHTGGRAAEAASTVSARAFTLGRDIVFGAGQYAPGTNSGKKLLAHELTHVLQQGAGQKTDGIIQRDLSPKQVQDAIDYNEKKIGGNADYLLAFVTVLNANLGTNLSNKAIDANFVKAISRYQEDLVGEGKSVNTDGKLTPTTRKLLSQDFQLLTTSASKASAKAKKAANRVLDIYMTENILFDSWGNDCRDNNKSGKVDQNDPKEKDAKDGDHKDEPHKGFKTIKGKYRGVTTIDFETNEPVKYCVCAHVVTRAYKNAGIMPGIKGSVAKTKDWFAGNKHSKCWKFGAKNFPAEYRAGDFICSIGDKGHGHAGMIVADEASNKGTVRPLVVHLPGPSLQIRRGEYNPIRLTDLRTERWPSPRPMHHLCRYKGK